MKKYLVPALVTLMVVGSGAAYAARVTGSIKSIDTSSHTVTLSNDKNYIAADKIDLTKLTTGENVRITYKVTDGKNMASSVTKVKPKTTKPKQS